MAIRINRKWKKRILIVVIVYVVTGIALYFLQDRFLFRPQPLSQSFAYKFKEPFKEVNIPITSESN
ncbi:MAG: hypothetical protein ABUT20_32105, partial [Bacteroidota bacterium]